MGILKAITKKNVLKEKTDDKNSSFSWDEIEKKKQIKMDDEIEKIIDNKLSEKERDRTKNEIIVDIDNRQFMVQEHFHHHTKREYSTNLPITMSDKKRLMRGESFISVESWTYYDTPSESFIVDRRENNKDLIRVCWYCDKKYGGTRCPYCGQTNWVRKYRYLR